MKLFKFLVFAAFAISLVSLAGNRILYQKLKTERAAREQIESRQVQLQERNAILEKRDGRSGQYERELSRLRVQIKNYVNQRDSVKKELDSAYQKIVDLEKNMKGLRSEKDELTTQLDIGEATDQAIVREATRVPVLSAPEPPPVSPAPPQEKGAEEKKEKSPPPTRVTEDPRPLQILSVNPQFQFVVVNVGLRGGVKVGDALRVERDGKLMGRIQVEKLYENFSACRIVEEVKPHKIREGDLVRPA